MNLAFELSELSFYMLLTMIANLMHIRSEGIERTIPFVAGFAACGNRYDVMYMSTWVLKILVLVLYV